MRRGGRLRFDLTIDGHARIQSDPPAPRPPPISCTQVGFSHVELVSAWEGYGDLYEKAKSFVAAACSSDPKYHVLRADPDVAYISRQG